MKIWKIVAGILTILSVLILVIYSFTSGTGSLIGDRPETNSVVGMIAAVLMLIGGIVSIVTSRMDGYGGSIALIVIFGAAFLCGIANADVFTGLYFLSWWCVIQVIVAEIALVHGLFFDRAFVRNILTAREQERTMPGGEVANWYYQNSGQWFGPFTRKDIPALAGNGVLTPETPVYYEGSVQPVCAKDSAIRGYFPLILMPRAKDPRILAPTICIPLVLLALAVVFAVAAGPERSGDSVSSAREEITEAAGDEHAEAAPAQDTGAEGGRIEPVSGSSAEEMRVRISEISSRLDALLETIGSEGAGNP